MDLNNKPEVGTKCEMIVTRRRKPDRANLSGSVPNFWHLATFGAPVQQDV